MKSNKYFLFIFFLFFCVSFVSATTECGKSIVELSSVIQQDDFTCNNEGNSSIFLSLTSDISDYIFVHPTILPPGESTIVTLDVYNTNIPAGNYEGDLDFSEVIPSIPVHLAITSDQSDPNACKLNPSLVSYTQTVQQGTVFELPKITFTPKNCDGEFSIMSPYISGGVTTSSGQKPVYIKSSSSKDIILGVDTTGLSSAPFKSTLTLYAFGQSFDVSEISIIVTGGTTPNVNFNVDSLPSCSLSSTTFTLNGTYSLTCTNIIPGVTISPIIDAEYIKGLGPGDTMSDTNFVWKFTPKKYGNTIIKAEYKYLSLPVGDPFSQEIKISSTGTAVPGTNLQIVFTPSLESLQDGEIVIIQLVDNKTGSLVSEPRVWVNAKELNGTGETFETSFVAETDYEIRGASPGYDNILETVKISPKPISIILNPASGDTNTIFSINTSIENATLFINDAVVENPYSGTLSGGINVIKAVKKGYTQASINLTISNIIRILSGGEDFKKGVLQTFILNQNASYKVYYQNSMDATKIDLLTFGDGNKIEFTPDDKGFYRIEANGMQLGPFYEIKGFSFKNKWWFMPAWGWILLMFIIIILAIIIIAIRRANSSESEGPSMVMPVGGGD